MATIKRQFASEATVLSASTITTAATGLTLTNDIDLETNGYDGAHVVIDVTWNASAASGVAMKLFGSLDASNYDDIAIWSQTLSASTGTSKQYSVIIHDLLHAKLGFNPTTSDDNAPTITVKHQCWNWESS